MSNIIAMVPIHVDGYLLSQDRLAVAPFADFERLPFTDGNQDFNPDTANVSDSILSIPFQNNNLTLGKGMHLHWSLPDALTKGGTSGAAVDYHAVPNRWLVKRKSSLLGDDEWIVESDYLHTELENPYFGVSYPLDTPDSSGQPYGFLGRRFSRLGWQEDATATRVARLTALGYGEPAFAAFYPNCHSVFGCFDPAVDTQAKTVGLSYQVFGWYSESANDPIALFLQENPGETNADMMELIRGSFSWNISLESDDVLTGMVCYAELEIDMSQSSDIEGTGKSADVTVSVGNTGTEALSAFLAADANVTNDATARTQLEEQLENLLLQTKLQANSLDLGARFIEARHEKGFMATKGGSIYEIQPENHDPSDKTADLNLPPAMESALSALNLAQQAADQAGYVLDQKRQILFADWSKYMVTAYPPDDIRDDHPEVDYVKHFIQSQDIPAIHDAIVDKQSKSLAVEPLQTTLQAEIDLFNESTIASSLLLRDFTAETIDQSQVTLTNATFPENRPFSDACAGFNGTDADLAIDFSTNGFTTVKALSMWVNIATLNDDNATLLSTQTGALIAKSGIADFWDKFVIDGVEQATDESLSWNDLPRDQWTYIYVEFTTALSDSDALYLFSNAGSNYAAGRLGAMRLFSAALSDDELYYDQNMRKKKRYVLEQVSGPHFWQPKEPVLLIEGDAAEPTIRHGADGRLNEDNTLDCDKASVGSFPLGSTDFATVLTAVEDGKPDSDEKIGYASQTLQPWNPFLLEWEVEMFPMSEGGNLDVDNREFTTDFLTSNYSLDENSPELTVQDGKSVIQAAAIYTGRSILTAYAKTQLLGTILGQLKAILKSDCYHVIGDITTDATSVYDDSLTTWFEGMPTLEDWYSEDADYDTAMSGFEAWYLTKPVYDGSPSTFQASFTDESTAAFDTEAARLSDFNYALIKAYQQVRASHFISQALSGFNNALLMHQQTLQIPVSDPLGFDHYQTFAGQVAEYVADNNNLAALPLNDFLPLRTGSMRIAKLQLIDSFGQRKTLEVDSVLKAEPLSMSDTLVANATDDDIWLPPRFVQPARLNFRWLSANSGVQELNSHPDSTPICGWILANNLDSSLDVYDVYGNALGVIDQEARWRSVPGTDEVLNPKDIENAYLRKVVQRLALVYEETDTNDAKKDFLADFISVTDTALDTIDPESFVHHKELSLLMGRPMAVVRATVGMELQGDPAIHQGWIEFRQDLKRETRETDGLETVNVPVRIGERGQLNDGVVGYWKEDTDSELDAIFHTTVAESDITNASIQSYEETPLDITQTVNGDATTLTLLVDPRGDFHATTGLLPVQSLFIPKSLYTDALARINITFLTAPILTGVDQVALPLPNELGYEWSWLAKDRFNWVEVANKGILRKDTVLKTFSNGDAVWTELLDQGWITQIDTNRARIVSADQRGSTTLDTPIASQTAEIQALLDASHIVPPNLQATFTQQHILKEGWLKLAPTADK